jgi:2-polyprenyl-3-methyl-5-hydroxy-6-metoxy-1,4-benzoquinol methylase
MESIHMNDYSYEGEELDLFAVAVNWKSYWASYIRRYLIGDVLEVGAGIGTNTELLSRAHSGRWVCLEPDGTMLKRAEQRLNHSNPSRNYEFVCGTAGSMSGQSFDTVIYIDVLEHIEHDRDEVLTAAALLKPGGHLVILSPAHQRLFTPFDAGIGHFRRYNKAMLRAIAPPSLLLKNLTYLDSVGLLASTANLLLLQQSLPKVEQLRFWDTWMIPVSRVLDPLLGHTVGKTIIAVWQSPNR